MRKADKEPTGSGPSFNKPGHRAVTLVACFLVTGALSSCGNRFFSDRGTNPVIEDYLRAGSVDQFAVLSITASRRNAYVKIEDSRIGVVCAEPPPDVGEAFAKAFAASADVNEFGGGSLSNTAATSIAPLLYRSQGLQMYRDAVSHLCFAYMNGAIDSATFLQEERERWADAIELVKVELPHMPDFKPSSPPPPAAPPSPELQRKSELPKEDENSSNGAADKPAE